MVQEDLTLRRTFEDVLKMQKQLRDFIEKLMEDDRACRNKEEGARLFDLVSRSCLGLEHNVDASFDVKDEKGFPAKWKGTLTDLIQIATYLTEPWTFTSEDSRVGIVQFKDLWQIILKSLYKAWALAKDRATSISPEHIPIPTRERF